MIFFLATRRNRHPMDRYLASWGRRFRSVIQPIEYEDFLREPELLPGVYFFADVELLDERQREQAVGVWERLARFGAAVRLVNHPVRSLRRYDLLRKLHAEGINDFNVYRAEEDLSFVRFPAFVRVENDHQGFRADPVQDMGTLTATLAELRARHPHVSDWLITEFCDTSGPDGIFRKHSAFLLNGRVIPRHLFFGRKWCLKEHDLVDESTLEAERSYLRNNPHEAAVKRVFELAGLEYGRIDYGWRDGGIRVWEINSNPMILSFSSYGHSARQGIHEEFARNLAAAWEEIAGCEPARRSENYRWQSLKARLYRVSEQPRVRRNYLRFANLRRRLRRMGAA